MNRFNIQARVLCLLLPAFLFSTNARAEVLNFNDSDINTVIETVAQATGKSFIVDPRVKGKVTVVSSGDMGPDALYQTFLSILQVHGYAAVQTGNIVKILPETNAKQAGNSAASGSRTPPDELVTRVIAVNHVSAPQLVPILRPLVPQYGHLAAYAPANILIISDRAANVSRLSQIVRRIDRGGDDAIEVVTLEHASASEVVRIVSQLQGQEQRQDGTAKPSVIADPRTNSVLIGGEKSDRLRLRTLVTHLDTPLQRNGDTNVVYLRYAQAANLSSILQGYTTGKTAANGAAGQNNAAQSSEKVTIIADESTNALIITAPPETMRELKSVIDQLDIRRAQVLVEAIIAEVGENASRVLGVELAGRPGNSLIFSQFGGGLLNAIGALAGSDDAAAFAAAAGSVSSGITGGVAADNSSGQVVFAGLLTALSGDTSSNVLSTPSLLTMDNEEAEISVGQEVPFVTGSFTNNGGTDGATNPFTTIQREDVGVTLRITPHVVDKDSLQLKIYQEVSNIAADTTVQTGASDLVTNKRTIETTVIAENGAIIALGGLIDDQVTDTLNKVPLLGDIPVLGQLFRNTSKTRRKRNLMIFIRPVILHEGADLIRYSQQRYEFLRRAQIVTNGVVGDEENNNKNGPLLPEYDNQTFRLDTELTLPQPLNTGSQHSDNDMRVLEPIQSPGNSKHESEIRVGPRSRR